MTVSERYTWRTSGVPSPYPPGNAADADCLHEDDILTVFASGTLAPGETWTWRPTYSTCQPRRYAWDSNLGLQFTQRGNRPRLELTLTAEPNSLPGTATFLDDGVLRRTPYAGNRSYLVHYCFHYRSLFDWRDYFIDPERNEGTYSLTLHNPSSEPAELYLTHRNQHWQPDGATCVIGT